MVQAMKSFRLNTGAMIPSVGLGTLKLQAGVVGDVITAAIKIGYRHIDCAKIYKNEKEIGVALKKLLDEGVVQREELFITSKLWCSDHHPECVSDALNQTLHDLQLEYVDLYLINWPASMKKHSVELERENLTKLDINGTWRAMEQQSDSGKAKAIGVSNFSMKKLEDLLSVARIIPAVNQVELHPVWQQPKLHEFCQSKGIHLSGYIPLGSPAGHMNMDVLDNHVIAMIAEKVGKTSAQVALRWGLHMGHSVLPKTTKEHRLKENFDVFDWDIPVDLLSKLSRIPQERLVKGIFLVVCGAYKSTQELWDGEM